MRGYCGLIAAGAADNQLLAACDRVAHVSSIDGARDPRRRHTCVAPMTPAIRGGGTRAWHR